MYSFLQVIIIKCTVSFSTQVESSSHGQKMHRFQFQNVIVILLGGGFISIVNGLYDFCMRACFLFPCQNLRMPVHAEVDCFWLSLPFVRLVTKMFIKPPWLVTARYLILEPRSAAVWPLTMLVSRVITQIHKFQIHKLLSRHDPFEAK